jgi:hypothetical protein
VARQKTDFCRSTFADLLRFGCRSGQKEGQIGAGRDVAGAHLNRLCSETGMGAEPPQLPSVFGVFDTRVWPLHTSLQREPRSPHRVARPEITDRLNQEINLGLADGRIAKRIIQLGDAVLLLSAAEFGKLMVDETEKWANVIRAVNIKAE